MTKKEIKIINQLRAYLKECKYTLDRETAAIQFKRTLTDPSERLIVNNYIEAML